MSSGSANTLDDLWRNLGLDSLPPDAGSAENLSSTRVPDWEVATLRQAPVEPPATERIDLPSISLSPPVSEPGGSKPAGRDLVVTGLLGEGGMGKVLLAHQASLGRDVAVKVPRANASPGTIKALISEGQTTGGLEHPGVIPVYSMASDAGGNPALVMKRVDGVSWSTLIRHAEDPAWSRLGDPNADRIEIHVELLRQVCNAIAFAHRKGVLHRDIKPANVLIGEFGEVYVADWGIAMRKVPRGLGADGTGGEKGLGADGTEGKQGLGADGTEGKQGQVRKPSLVGSPVYLAPEMVTGEDAEVDERTDVFLLGATLYELLTGNPPWSGPDLRAVLEAAWECQPKALPASAPPELAAICLKAMATLKDDRYPSALEFREALGGFLRHRGSVRLARAADERLQTLLATLASTSRENVYPLLSECRFGFTQALREWPENTIAKEGLARCLEATARYEVSQGNLAAARALLGELKEVPADLLASVEELEKAATETKRRQARLEHLSQEMDPRLASRQRVRVFAVTVIAIAVTTIVPEAVPFIRQALREKLGQWMLSVRMAGPVVIFAIAVFVGRRSILSTRINRRLTGMVGLAALGTLAQRLVAAVMGLGIRETVLQNFVLVALIAITGGLTLHWGFFWSGAAMAVGGLIALLLPGYEIQLFNIASVGALVFAVLSWRGWRGELSLKRE